MTEEEKKTAIDIAIEKAKMNRQIKGLLRRHKTLEKKTVEAANAVSLYRSKCEHVWMNESRVEDCTDSSDSLAPDASVATTTSHPSLTALDGVTTVSWTWGGLI